MEILQQLIDGARPFVPLLVTVGAVVAVILGTRTLLERRYGEVPAARFRIQLVMLALSFSGLLAIVVALPVSDTLRGQLLSLIGILLSAAIALSSTTFLGNAMAGILLRIVRSYRLGDFISVGEHFGRASERGLFHTEIQTEDRDLTTLPNLYLVTHPVKVIHSTGTIVSATVSLGYDLPRTEIEKLLLQAAQRVGLQEPFVHIVELGDFSVTYRIAGLLTEVTRLLSTRSELRAAVLDELHGAGVEIVSPNFMNTRALPEGARIIPETGGADGAAAEEPARAPEAVVFDKAEEAGQLEELSRRHQALASQIDALQEQLKQAEADTTREALQRRISKAEAERGRLEKILEQAAAEAAKD